MGRQGTWLGISRSRCDSCHRSPDRTPSASSFECCSSCQPSTNASQLQTVPEDAADTPVPCFSNFGHLVAEGRNLWIELNWSEQTKGAKIGGWFLKVAILHRLKLVWLCLAILCHATWCMFNAWCHHESSRDLPRQAVASLGLGDVAAQWSRWKKLSKTAKHWSHGAIATMLSTSGPAVDAMWNVKHNPKTLEN